LSQEENDALGKYASKNSKHLTGEAIDLIDMRLGYLLGNENKNHKFFKDLEELANKYELKWGGNFKSRWDPHHIEAR